MIARRFTPPVPSEYCNLPREFHSGADNDGGNGAAAKRL